MITRTNIQRPLSNFACFETHDPDEWQTFISDKTTFSKYSFTISNNFFAFFNTTMLGVTRINSIGNSSSFSHQSIHENDEIFCNLLLSGNFQTETKKDIACYKQNGIAISCHKGTARKVHSEHPNSIQINFPSAAINKLIHSSQDKVPQEIKDFSQTASNFLGHVIRHVASSLNLFPHIVNHPTIATQYEQLLYMSFIHSYPEISAHILSNNSNRSRVIVKIVEEYIEANTDKPFRLEELVSLTGLSIRTIQETFKKYRGYSPSQFLREHRLLAAHKIIQESPPDTSILSIALSCGFATHAHFSESYKKRFGVTPLESQNNSNA